MTLLLLALNAHAVPAVVPVHGKLTASGERVDDRVRIDVALYDAEGAATPLWMDTFSVEVHRGTFTVELGSQSLLDTDVFASNPSLWLGFTVEGDTEMPRVAVGGTARVARAQSAEDAASVGDRDLDSLQITEAEVIAAADEVCFSSAAEVETFLDALYLRQDDPLAWAELQGIPSAWAAGNDLGEDLDTYEEILPLIVANATWDTTPDTWGDGLLGDAKVPDDITLAGGNVRAVPGEDLVAIGGELFRGIRYTRAHVETTGGPGSYVEVQVGGAYEFGLGCHLGLSCQSVLTEVRSNGQVYSWDGSLTYVGSESFIAGRGLFLSANGQQWMVRTGWDQPAEQWTTPTGNCILSTGDTNRGDPNMDTEWDRFELRVASGAPAGTQCGLTVVRQRL